MAPRGVSSHSSPSMLSVASSSAKSAKKIITSVKKVVSKGATAVARPFKKSRKSQASDALSVNDTSTLLPTSLLFWVRWWLCIIINEDLNSERPPSLIDVNASQDQDSDKQEEGETNEQELSEFGCMISFYTFSHNHVRAPQEYLAFICLWILQIQGPDSIREWPKVSPFPMCCQEVQRTWLCLSIPWLSRPCCNIQLEDACSEMFWCWCHQCSCKQYPVSWSRWNYLCSLCSSWPTTSYSIPSCSHYGGKLVR